MTMLYTAPPLASKVPQGPSNTALPLGGPHISHRAYRVRKRRTAVNWSFTPPLQARLSCAGGPPRVLRPSSALWLCGCVPETPDGPRRTAPSTAVVRSHTALGRFFSLRQPCRRKNRGPLFLSSRGSAHSMVRARPGRNVRPSLMASARAATTAHELKALGWAARARAPC